MSCSKREPHKTENEPIKTYSENKSIVQSWLNDEDEHKDYDHHYDYGCNYNDTTPEGDEELFPDIRKGLRSRGDRPRGAWRNLADGMLRGLGDGSRSQRR